MIITNIFIIKDFKYLHAYNQHLFLTKKIDLKIPLSQNSYVVENLLVSFF